MTKKRNHSSSGGGGGGGGFQSLGLSDAVYRGIQRMGFRAPTPVQRKSLPVILAGSDAVVMARTGSGKTAAFLIPLLEKLLANERGGGGGGDAALSLSSSSNHNRSASAVILSPTRELSLQTLRVLQSLSKFTNVASVGINGGESMEKQFASLSSKPDVIVATPGRLAHHLSEIPDLHLRHCDTVVFDEADRLFEMGFASQIRQICRTMPESRQTLLFSATMPKVLAEFTKTGMMHEPVVVRLDQEVSVSAELRIGFVTCRSDDKDAVLLHLLRDVLPRSNSSSSSAPGTGAQGGGGKGAAKETRTKGTASSSLGLTLVFAATRHHVEYLTTLLRLSGVAATQIYGTMDQDARKANLSSFRTGQTPVLVVTDVAARGIDVPLIDHVVHYAFPPSAKLFVHRSGRAARAGRIGYCWGLVEPDEMPYMVDLHLFLGRKLSNGGGGGGGGDGGIERRDGDDAVEGTEDESTYTLSEMTPDMVNYGTVPESILVEEVENVRRIVDSELAGSHDAEALRSLSRVCVNAMKQYRRSRPEASREGSRRAKAILEGEKEASGRRVGGGIVPVHPLLRGIERERILSSMTTASSSRSNSGGDGKDGDVTDSGKKRDADDARDRMENFKKREEFLRAMANFRPKETIFETFGTGGGKSDAGVVSQVDKGRTTSAKKHDSSVALVAMKSMRRQMKLARDKGSALVVAGSKNALALNGELIDDAAEEMAGGVHEGGIAAADAGETDDTETGVIRSAASAPADANASGGRTLSSHEPAAAVAPPLVPEGKRRLSKAERKRLKKNPRGNLPSPNSSSTEGKKSKEKRGADFRDPAFFIDNDFSSNADAAARSRQIEAAMQPSSSSNNKGSQATALRIEESMLDIVGDENDDLVKRQRMMRWDKSKRKYVQTTVGSELSGDSKSKKMRLESGRLVKSDKVKLGELYEKWQKKTNRSVGRVGVFDDVTTDEAGIGDVIPRPGGGRAQKRNRLNDEMDDGRKTATQIRKEREAKQNMKVKNMKKGDRRRLESRERQKKTDDVANRPKGFQGKRGKSGFWGKKKR